ncbi:MULTISPECIES: hypothetical protein [Pectobacterium]|uniref:hypothetical protein n=1 Tax=Pectobacterium TaxID=122277 RepID=UPI0004E7475F|nr:hypothetical protein [Pectobacterium brasiliense]ARA78440.1 hypothetical protein B5S52_22245 [Pectobacterium brasiliense]KFF69846.1 hypothetical protein IV99_00640 [Pectobacterium brasiliense]MBN3131076.1 hypothetical protein [Pectobacterium brasiliense]
MKEYKILVKNAFDRIPFSAYIKRLAFFLKSPDIGSSYSAQQQREMAFIDIFNSLGLLTLTTTIITLCNNSLSEFKIILAFNPLFITFSFVSNALLFSFFCSLTLTIAIRFSKSPKKNNTRTNFFNIFTHGLRCYAAYGILFGIPFIKISGNAILNGVSFNESLYNPFWLIYISLILCYIFFRIVINPLYRYCELSKSKKTSWIMVFILFILSFEPLNWFYYDYSEKMLDYNVLCSLMEKGEVMKRIPQERKKEALQLICNTQ